MTRWTLAALVACGALCGCDDGGGASLEGASDMIGGGGGAPAGDASSSDAGSAAMFGGADASSACASGPSPGCACARAGDTAPCFTGPASSRNHGACKDGTTTCGKTGELASAWGACVGEVLDCGDAAPPPPAPTGFLVCNAGEPCQICECVPGAVINCASDCGAGISSGPAVQECGADGAWGPCHAAAAGAPTTCVHSGGGCDAGADAGGGAGTYAAGTQCVPGATAACPGNYDYCDVGDGWGTETCLPNATWGGCVESNPTGLPCTDTAGAGAGPFTGDCSAVLAPAPCPTSGVFQHCHAP